MTTKILESNLLDTFIHATSDVLGTMCQTTVTAGVPYLKPTLHTWGEVTGIIGLTGDVVEGNLLISFDRSSIVSIVNRMLAEQFDGLNPDVIEAVGELTNMICGGAKRGLAEHGLSFGMTRPLMIVGSKVELSQISKCPITVVPFQTSEGSFVVEASIEKVG